MSLLDTDDHAQLFSVLFSFNVWNCYDYNYNNNINNSGVNNVIENLSNGGHSQDNDINGDLSDSLLSFMVNLVSISGEQVVKKVIEFLIKNLIPTSDAYIEKNKELRVKINTEREKFRNNTNNNISGMDTRELDASHAQKHSECSQLINSKSDLVKDRADASNNNNSAKSSDSDNSTLKAAEEIIRMTHLNGIMLRVRRALEQVFDLVPLASTIARPLLLVSMPHSRRRKEIQCCYLYSVFGLIESSGLNAKSSGLWESMIGGVVEKLLEVDAEVEWQHIQNALQIEMDQEIEARNAALIAREQENSNLMNNDDEGIESGIFDLEESLVHDGMKVISNGNVNGTALHLNSTEKSLLMNERDRYDMNNYGGNGDMIIQGREQTQELNGIERSHRIISVQGAGFAQQVEPVPSEIAFTKDEGITDLHEKDRIEKSLLSAEKLDAMMDITLAHLQRQCVSIGQQEVLRVMILIFERVLLLAHKSKFTQFILFHAISLDTQPLRSTTQFCQILINKYIGDSGRPGITRLAALAYFSSFLARFVRLSDSTIIESVQWLTSYYLKEEQLLQKGTPNYMSPNIEDGTSTTITSDKFAVMSGICQALVYILCYRLKAFSNSDVYNNTKIELRKVLFGPLKPIRHCLPHISEEFLRQAGKYKLFSADDLTALGNEISDGESSSRLRDRPLEMFFPFDPYLLRISSKRLSLERNYMTADRAGIYAVIDASDGQSDDSSLQEDDQQDPDVEDDEEDDEQEDDEQEEEDSSDDEMVRSFRSDAFGMTPESPEGSPANGQYLPGAWELSRPKPISMNTLSFGGSIGANATGRCLRQTVWSDGSSLGSDQDWTGGATPMSIGASPITMPPADQFTHMKSYSRQGRGRTG